MGKNVSAWPIQNDDESNFNFNAMKTIVKIEDKVRKEVEEYN